MRVSLCSTSSENNAINKNITEIEYVDAIVKGNSSIYKPSLILSYSGSMENINYIYIPSYERYYFITNIIGMTGHRYEVNCKVDVLESFKSEILNHSVILEATQNTGSNKYLNGLAWVTNVKNNTTIIPFSDGLLTDGEYILITAGGV